MTRPATRDGGEEPGPLASAAKPGCTARTPSQLPHARKDSTQRDRSTAVARRPTGGSPLDYP